MKKLNQLLIVESDPLLPPLLQHNSRFLSAASESSLGVLSWTEATTSRPQSQPQLILLHGNLTTAEHLRTFVDLHAAYPYSSIIVVSEVLDDELCLLALEAGADDCVATTALTPHYLQKAGLQAERRRRTETLLRENREQLLSCIENTPNLAVQWYNEKGEVVYWNRASEEIFGWRREEALGKTLDRLIQTPAETELFLQKLRDVKHTGKSSGPDEWEYRDRSGRQRHCISTVLPIGSREGDALFGCMDVEITDRKEMEKALRESEEKNHNLFSQASDAIFINTLEGRLLDANERACELLGYSRDELLQRSVEDMYTPEELRVRPIMRTELETGQRTFVRRNIRRANGEELPVEVTAQRLTDGRVMAIVRDVSEQQRTLLALMQSEEKYRSLIEQQADAITIFDTEGRIVDVNSSATVLLQYSKEEFQQLRLTDVLLKEDLKANPVDFTLLGSGASTIKQRKMRRKDGSVVETEVHAKRLYDGLFLASVRDLTERIETQRRLKTESELSDSIINSLPGLFYLHHPTNGLLRWNRQLERISGYNAAELQEMLYTDFFAPEERPVIEEAVKVVFEKGENAAEANLLTKDGKKIPFYFTGRAIDYGGEPCFLGTGIDLSEVKRLQMKLSRQRVKEQKRIIQAMIEAEEKEKNKLGLELHDNVNQILSVVRMYLTILASDQPLEEVTLDKAVKLLDNAIQEIRDLSHSLAIGYKFEAGLGVTLQDLVNKVQLARDFTVNLAASPHLDEYTNSRQKLAVYRIVQEQLNNIIKHAAASKVDINIDLRNNELHLLVADNGKGFDLSKAKKGLGLNTMINRAEALGGKATVQSEPGKGYRLMVIIPVSGS